MQSTEQLPCGNGVKKSSRTCSNPFPAHGGHHCAGDSILFHPCDAGECPGEKHKSSMVKKKKNLQALARPTD